MPFIICDFSKTHRELDRCTESRKTVLAGGIEMKGIRGTKSRKPNGLSQLNVSERALSTQQNNQDQTLKAQTQA